MRVPRSGTGSITNIFEIRITTPRPSSATAAAVPPVANTTTTTTTTRASPNHHQDYGARFYSNLDTSLPLIETLYQHKIIDDYYYLQNTRGYSITTEFYCWNKQPPTSKQQPHPQQYDEEEDHRYASVDTDGVSVCTNLGRKRTTREERRR